MKNKISTAILCVFTVLLIITFSISLPICIRPFYYAHIEKYNLVEVTGKSKTQIIEAYDDVLDYLTLPNKEFSTGDFAYSKEGKSHFADCKALFTLNFTVLFVSLAVIILLNVLKYKKIITFAKPFSLNASFTSGIATLSLFTVIGLLAALDFDKAFVVFHNIFFFGKDNWLFDSSIDQIISALPQEFFLNCGILIIASIFIISISLIIYAIFKKEN